MNYGITDVITLFGSLGLFLYGMKVMSDSLMEAAGDRMRNVLATMTSNRVFAVSTGFLITSVIQSSSATTLMVVSFVNARLLTLSEAIGVILGAHIGTTVTAWLITLLGFKVSMSAIALPLVGLGFFLTFSKNQSVRNWGKFIVGFAILFIGLQFLKDSVPDIKSHPQALEFLTAYTSMGFASVLLFLLIGTILTLIIQSSSATMALTLVMCNEGWLPFDMAAAMVLGENIGTTITANLASIVANFNAKRAARAHFISQTIGVILMLLIFYPFLRTVDSFVHFEGVSAFATATAIPVSLSAFHTAFNVFNTLVLIWFVGGIVKIVEWMVPETKDPERDIDEPKYLSESALKYPQTAIRALFDETKRLFEGPCFEIVSHALNIHREDIKSGQKLKEIISASTEEMKMDIDAIYYQKVKSIYSSIIEFATRVQGEFQLSAQKTSSIYELKVANRYIVESIKNSKGLHKNISKFMASDNPHIRAEYNQLRKKVSKVLRRVYLTGHSDNPLNHLPKLLKLKEKAKQSDVLVNGRLDELIRNGLIDSEMATSLANDSDNVAGITRNLIRIAELLYIHRDTMLSNLDPEALESSDAVFESPA
ncbi:MAG: Na/Pi cotransporter family protein [Acidobacteriota bacterium]|nr:Na/Pi cotransporter family protein [Acidobacteriota bacterium]MDH3528416.1 Na/Pi cotransporter family protein [Acidobacteriota bacterium]